ncbi:Isochorismate synthase DhbC [Corynebacterium heidelbergense]|uniref:isochorismate synthase n=1 Tax=Corynebacterium heidelbergense TaxID=2055947 RepID=UPI0023594594|nr:isochorismate synthase [Corynebacterium heidelbergense]WCZ36833.1 Isochorismate synthase DhbC [Corynebacterium heidelbergense]
MTEQRRPPGAPDFLLSRPHHSIRTQGRTAIFPDPFEAATALRNGEVELVVGAIPFDTANRAALMVPQSVVRSEGPLEPPAYYRGKKAAEALEIEDVHSSSSLEEHQATVAAAVATMQQTRLEKVVLARSVDVTFRQEVDPLLIAARFIDLASARNGFAVDLGATGREDDAGAMFVGSSPEQLIRRRDRSITAFPLAGSGPRTGDAQVDDATAARLLGSAKDLAEHRFVVEHYRRVLTPLCADLRIPETPELMETNEMIHLGTHIEGTLADEEYSALDLALILHPTPAIAGTPTDDALGIINQVEEDREFYAGAVGWCDSSGDGEWMVSIRCACVGGSTARAWAGGGIVATSSPAEEVEETTAKLQTALRALNVPVRMRQV